MSEFARLQVSTSLAETFLKSVNLHARNVSLLDVFYKYHINSILTRFNLLIKKKNVTMSLTAT